MEETINGEKKLVLTYSKETAKAFQDEQLAYKNLTKEEMLQKNVELDKRLSIIEHHVFKMLGNKH